MIKWKRAFAGPLPFALYCLMTVDEVKPDLLGEDA